MGKFKGKKKSKKPEIKKIAPKTKTRKDIRKEKRTLKKIHKQEYFSKSNKTSHEVGKFVKAPVSDEDDDVPSLIEIKDKKVTTKKIKNNLDKDNIIIQENKGAKKREEKLKLEMKNQRNSQLMKANEDEDKIIKKLEKQLKLRKVKSGKISKGFSEDGLDYLLEVCDENTMSAAVAAEKHLAETGSGSDFEDDVAIATGQAKMKSNKDSMKRLGTHSKITNEESDDEDIDMMCSEDNTEEDDSIDEEEHNIPLKISKYDNKKKGFNSKKNKLNENTSTSVKSYKFLKKNRDNSCSSEGFSSDEDSDENFNEEDNDDSDDSDFNENDDADSEEEEIRSINSGLLSSFPDDSFTPGNLTPVKEETELDLDLYRRNIVPKSHPIASISNIKSSETMKSKMQKSDDEDCFESDEEKHIDLDMEEEEEEMFEDESDFEEMDSEEHSHNFEVNDSESDDSECSNPDCGDDHSNDSDNPDHIIVNGKKINTYGRHVPSDTEPEIVRCPKLDKLLENLDSDNEQQMDDSASQTSDSKSKRKRDSIENTTQKNKKLKISPMENKRNHVKEKKCNKNEPKKKKMKMKNDVLESDDDDDDDNSEMEISDDSKENSSSENLSNDEKGGGDGLWEDIYGRQRDKKGNVLTTEKGKYVPPHLRAKSIQDNDSREILQLKRQIKGLLNKVASSNMHWTSTQLENMYSSNSRNAVNSAFSSLWIAALIQNSLTPERMATEHAMLIAILHANVGSDVGAHFLQTAIKKFDEMISEKQDVDNKQLDNLILSIAQLYNFKIFHASLLYEVLDKLLEHLGEKTVECCLLALRNVGGALRKDDPALLKTFIHNTQEKAVKYRGGFTSGSRMKFLLDVLMAIKNNNLNKIPHYDQSYSDELKKAMKGIIRKGNYIVPLNIKLDDLLKADEKGKWWVVGSAWEGSSNKQETQESGSSKDLSDTKHAHLLELAKSQRINTDLRRNIFFVIMSAEDYLDAFEKLQQLGLKNVQEREIIHVLVACCLQEKEYNPYYAVLAQKFCDYDRKFQLAIQYCVWDKLKEIDSYSSFQIANLGQFLTHLFNEKGLAISILKVVQFSDLTKSTLRLMRQILLAILLQKQWQTCLEVFQRVAVSPKLHLFRESLRLFISHFLLKNTEKKENVLSEDQMTLLKERASAVNKTLHSDSKQF